MPVRSHLCARSLAGALLAVSIGCSSAPSVSSNPVLLDPTRTAGMSGGTDDIYEATQYAITSLVANSRVRQQKGNRIVLNEITNKTGTPDYDANIIYNRFLSSLMESSGDKFIFLNRESAARERSLQQAGQVKTSGLEPAMAGADMVLDIEILGLRGGRSQTLQYTFRLTNMAGEMVWQSSKEIKKDA